MGSISHKYIDSIDEFFKVNLLQKTVDSLTIHSLGHLKKWCLKYVDYNDHYSLTLRLRPSLCHVIYTIDLWNILCRFPEQKNIPEISKGFNVYLPEKKERRNICNPLKLIQCNVKILLQKNKNIYRNCFKGVSIYLNGKSTYSRSISFLIPLPLFIFRKVLKSDSLNLQNAS